VLYSVPLSRYSRNVVELDRASSTGLTLTGGEGRLATVLKNHQLHPVFQPIIHLGEATVYAHEALIRGLVGSDLYSPDALLAAAAAENLEYEFEMACIQVQLQAWNQRKVSGRLFLNISSTTLIEMMTTRGIHGIVSLLSR